MPGVLADVAPTAEGKATDIIGPAPRGEPLQEEQRPGDQQADKDAADEDGKAVGGGNRDIVAGVRHGHEVPISGHFN